MVYQLTCTSISIFLNLVLLMLIWRKSPPQTGRYRWLMTFTACFEIFWGAFDLPAEIIAHSVGCAFITFRINKPDAMLDPEHSSWVVLTYTAIFGASMAVFASHFVYRYGSIEKSFGKKFTSGWKFGLLFFFPMLYCFWWGAVVKIWFWKNPDMDEYTRDVINRTTGQPIENISYIGTKFYNFGPNGTMTFNKPAWIGVTQMWFMVGTSIGCVFGFGILCYLRLSNTLSIVSSSFNNLQKQLFYALVLQTMIPLVLMHTPITVFFLCPMLNIDTDFATALILITITLYPAVDPLPSFFIIKSYREAMLEIFRAVLCLNRASNQVGDSMISHHDAVPKNSVALTKMSTHPA
ncbi:hypothetical protein B9Z55_020285 [Caenorhabditis nigoni]|uniref:Seven TM Receptor n=2 Tax=Caenorhabditis nigoni TaxID=1611254 RepID=A0A2G5TM15_9PELO|nr:hypothetical protein B9Z55_020285 [Caenorhabditis nigoni]